MRVCAPVPFSIFEIQHFQSRRGTNHSLLLSIQRHFARPFTASLSVPLPTPSQSTRSFSRKNERLAEGKTGRAGKAFSSRKLSRNACYQLKFMSEIESTNRISSLLSCECKNGNQRKNNINGIYAIVSVT